MLFKWLSRRNKNLFERKVFQFFRTEKFFKITFPVNDKFIQFVSIFINSFGINLFCSNFNPKITEIRI